MIFKRTAAAVSGALAAQTLACGAIAQPAPVSDLAAKFGARADVRQITLSPDGQQVAFLSSGNPRGEVLSVANVADGHTKAILNAAGGDEHISRCSWITNDRLLCDYRAIKNIAGQLLGFSRMLAVDADGSRLKVLFQNQSPFRQLSLRQSGGDLIDFDGGEPGSVLVSREYAKERTIGTRLAEDRDGLGVDRLDTTTLRRRPIEQPKRTAVEYISDGHGAIRVMGLQPPASGGYAATFIDYMYRPAQGGDGWKPLSRIEFNGAGWSGFNPSAVDRGLDVVYGFQDHDGYSALYSIALDGSGASRLVAGRPGVDVDGLVRIGRSRRVVGVSYAQEYRVVDIFDPDIKSMLAMLHKSFPADRQLQLLDASADESKFLVEVTADDDPGTIYLFDRKTRELRDLLLVRPQLANLTLAKMKPVTYAAADGTKIPAYLTLPPGKENAKGLPAIVMPHGGPSARDEWGFDWLVQYYAQRGFAVLQPNYRGSAGYGENWLMQNGFKSWRSAIGDIDDAGRWLVSQGIAAPDKLAIVGWSYGGYAALQSGVTEPGLFKAIVAIAPVTDLALLREESRDFTNFRFVDRQIGDGPQVAAGSPAQHAGAIAVPVLMFHGTLDQNVDIEQTRLMQRRLQSASKTVDVVEFEGLAHSLDDSVARRTLLSQSNAFLRRTMGMQ
ncbi:S9 family peptidase [Novosphingobium sp. 1949]|uniref:S9 family peptidase n=1 Tax=Novosphingobium organovorum TaxID=2930092 RepID=A0ABT0BAA2_9SPHN|nr:S9 family peptidase [Novosphingobium organovorum]MCJ2181724.1 S9 family peptidase [Novosphingobium organovorum]